MTAINLMHHHLVEMRSVWPHAAPTRGSDKAKWLLRQILVLHLLLHTSLAQPIPFSAPEMWTRYGANNKCPNEQRTDETWSICHRNASWQAFHSLMQQAIVFLAGTVLHQVDPKHSEEIVSLILIQLRWTTAKLIEIQSLEYPTADD
jgi:hypothetical protein